MFGLVIQVLIETFIISVIAFWLLIRKEQNQFVKLSPGKNSGLFIYMWSVCVLVALAIGIVAYLTGMEKVESVFASGAVLGAVAGYRFGLSKLTTMAANTAPKPE